MSGMPTSISAPIRWASCAPAPASWADEGPAYMAAAVTYLSPVIAGFDAGISFTPNNSGPFDGSGCSAAYGGVGCATQSSSIFTGDVQNRYRNEVSMALRYRNVLGPVGFDMSGIWSEQQQIIFDPIPRADGIEASADPLFEPRANIYLMSGRRRREAGKR